MHFILPLLKHQYIKKCCWDKQSAINLKKTTKIILSKKLKYNLSQKVEKPTRFNVKTHQLKLQNGEEHWIFVVGINHIN